MIRINKTTSPRATASARLWRLIVIYSSAKNSLPRRHKSLGCPTTKYMLYSKKMRKHPFINGEFYHIYNRGTEKSIIFPGTDDFDRFLKRMGGYTRYINIKYKMNGVLFQGKFKSKHINSNNYLLHLSAYVNLNNLVHKLKNREYRSSCEEYIRGEKGICSKYIILEQFKSTSEYKEFAGGALQNILEKKEMDKELESILLDLPLGCPTTKW